MSIKQTLLQNWLPVLVWMAVIFSASSDSESSDHSSRIIGPIARWLYPQISQSELDTIVHGVRKAAHVTEYAILAALLSRALRRHRRSRSSSPSCAPDPAAALQAWGLAALYAVSDEVHQLFVPTRTGQWQDVVIDSSGALLGLVVLAGLRLVLRRCQRAESILG